MSLSDIETGVSILLTPGWVWRVPADWPGGVRHRGGASSVQAPVWNVGTPRLDVIGRVLERSASGRTSSGGNREGESTDAGQGGGPSRSSGEGPVMGLERRGRVVLVRLVVNQGSWEEPGERIEAAGQAV